MSGSPRITREVLADRLRSEETSLDGDDLAWWRDHRVEPFLLPRHGLSPFAVAKSGDVVLVFFDDRDAFGRYRPEPWSESLILYTDLADAVRCLAAGDLMSRVLSETASDLLRSGILERGDAATQRRVLHVLRACGPDAAVAVPRLIELMSCQTPAGGLQESAVATLAAVGPGAFEAVPRLIAMAELDTANARGWCLKAFAAIGPAAAPAVPILIDLLLKRVNVRPDPCYVPMAATALGNIGAIEALPALLQVLRETDDQDVATAVLDATGMLGPAAAEAAPTLAVLAEALPGANRFPENVVIREAAFRAFHRVERPKPVDPPEA